MELADVRCLAVLGLRRSGRPAALLARRRLPAARVVALDEGAACRRRRAGRARAPPASRSCSAPAAVLPDGVDLLVKSPGVPDESPVVQEALRRGVAAVERGRVRRALPAQPRRRHHRHQRQDDDHRAHRRHLPRRRPAGGRRRQRRPRARRHAGRGRRRTRPSSPSSPASSSSTSSASGPTWPCCSTSPRTTSTGTAPTAPTWTPSCASSRTRRADDLALLNADDPGIRRRAAAGAARRARPARLVLGRAAAAPRAAGGELLVAGVGEDDVLWLRVHGELRARCAAATSSRCKGDHNLQNSLAAAAAACAVGAPAAAVASTLRTFEGVPHRLQVGGRRRRRHLRQRLQGDQRRRDAQGAHRLHRRRPPDPRRLRQGRRVRRARRGHRGTRAARCCSSARRRRSSRRRSPPGRPRPGRAPTPYVVCGDLEAAVAAAARRPSPGDVVLLSPACASWDQYRDYEERGEHFLRLVSELRGAEAA